MKKDFAFLFMPGDYLRDTQCLSEKTQVAYDRIMCEHMRNICIPQKQLEFFTKRLNEDELFELFSVLVETPEGFYIEWVRESILKRTNYIDSRRKNREGNQKNICDTYDLHMENEIENDNNNIIDNKKEEERKNQFDEFRKLYPGTKRGLLVEYENFKKKHKDWKEIIPLLNIRLDYQKTVRAKKLALKTFVPEWKNLQTWINQRCWEEEIPIDTASQAPITYEEIVARSEKDPGIWNRYKAVKREGERKALFYPINIE